MDKLLKAVWL